MDSTIILTLGTRTDWSEVCDALQHYRTSNTYLTPRHQGPPGPDKNPQVEILSNSCNVWKYQGLIVAICDTFERDWATAARQNNIASLDPDSNFFAITYLQETASSLVDGIVKIKTVIVEPFDEPKIERR